MTGEIVPGWSQRLHLCCNFMSIQNHFLEDLETDRNHRTRFYVFRFSRILFLNLNTRRNFVCMKVASGAADENFLTSEKTFKLSSIYSAKFLSKYLVSFISILNFQCSILQFLFGRKHEQTQFSQILFLPPREYKYGKSKLVNGIKFCY